MEKQVIDEKHGIEVITLGSKNKYYLPYYWDGMAFRYYKGNNPLKGLKRATYTTYEGAYKHIAKSRRIVNS